MMMTIRAATLQNCSWNRSHRKWQPCWANMHERSSLVLGKALQPLWGLWISHLLYQVHKEEDLKLFSWATKHERSSLVLGKACSLHEGCEFLIFCNKYLKRRTWNFSLVCTPPPAIDSSLQYLSISSIPLQVINLVGFPVIVSRGRCNTEPLRGTRLLSC